VAGEKVKLRPASFDDHYSQATMFYRSLTDAERDHIVGAFSFELAKCVSPEVRRRMVTNLANVDAGLAGRVAAHLGIEAPDVAVVAPAVLSPTLSMAPDGPGPVAGRLVAVLVDDQTPRRAITAWRTAADPLGVEIVAVGPHLGRLDGNVEVDRSVHITDPVEYDGVVLAAAPDPAVAAFVQEAFRHHKTIGLLDPAVGGSIGVDPDAAGVCASPGEFFDALALHRHWDR
jgi:catalase